MINNYLIYVSIAIAVTAVPGPAVLLTIKNSVNYGYRSAAANIFGNFIAMVILASLSALGLGAIIITSPTLYAAVKIIGCLYLIFLGIKSFKSNYLASDSAQQLINQRTFASMFKEGFYVGMTNPKAIAFFTALFPQFIDTGRDYLPQFLILIFTIEGISFIVLMTYSLLAAAAAKYILKEKPLGLFKKLTGTLFIGFGIALLLEE
jgi:threonine/homoserine/homoserine lactone efflux protein